jgi:hypothetical protein
MIKTDMGRSPTNPDNYLAIIHHLLLLDSEHCMEIVDFIANRTDISPEDCGKLLDSLVSFDISNHSTQQSQTLLKQMANKNVGISKGVSELLRRKGITLNPG